MDHTGIRRQAGFTTRLALNITLNLMRGKTIVGVCNVAQTKNNLITRVYAILAAQSLSNALVPTVAGSYYTFLHGGSLEIVLEQSLPTASLRGKTIDCVFSDPGRLTLVERGLIIPYCTPNFQFIDEHNVTLPTGIILPSSVQTQAPKSSGKKISSR